MQQYKAIKAQHQDALLFFRLGDFYELFGQDAVEASKILDITLTARNKKNDPIPMCGVPYHAAENYIARLTKAGKKVAICEQMSDPNLPGIVERQVVKVITPGTTYSDQVLSQKQNRFIVALFPQADTYGLAFADLSTGEFYASEPSGDAQLKTELLRLNPVEIVLARAHYDHPSLRVKLSELTSAPFSYCDLYEEAPQFIKAHFRLNSLEAFGLGSWPFATQAAALLLKFLKDTQKDSLEHIDRIRAHHQEGFMTLDEATLRNLELFSTLMGNEKEATLLTVLDHTSSPMGARLLRRAMSQPLTDKMAIVLRHDAVAELKNAALLRAELQENLETLLDLERLLARLSAGMGNARDLKALADSLEKIPVIKDLLRPLKSKLLQTLMEDLQPQAALVNHIENALLDELPLKVTEGGFIKAGYHKELDELHALMKDGKTALKNIEEKERQATGINSLKIGFNRIFGYSIEVSKIHAAKIPDHYIRKQTLVNAERYITPELKEFEDQVLHAEEKAKNLEYELFLMLRDKVLDRIGVIKQNAATLAQLDLMLSFARLAVRSNYSRPILVDEAVFEVKNGRHPVVESIKADRSFVPNDLQLQSSEAEIILLTGPNMSGKSTYLRQAALIAYLAQIGSFVPAEEVKMHVFDRIFTRVGASDNLAAGQSTFMVEMQEAANILHHATDRSLIILDEVGRGTSTYDGLSIAWAILEHLQGKVRAFALFATHYHELIELAEKLPRVKNAHVDTEKTAKGVLFLHKIKEGGIDQSYGIEVARLAGLPREVVGRANEILQTLERHESPSVKVLPKNQLDLFSQGLEHPALSRLKELNVNELTPLDALNLLSELQQIKE